MDRASSNKVAHPAGCLMRVFMLPDANDCPARSVEPQVGVAIALDGPPQLLGPPGGVVLGRDGMDRAPMPEAAIDEHSDSASREHHVRTPSEVGQSSQVYPVPQPERVQLPTQGNLGRGVSRLLAPEALPDVLRKRRWRVAPRAAITGRHHVNHASTGRCS